MNVQKLEFPQNSSYIFIALLVASLPYISLLPQVSRLRCNRILLPHRPRMGLYLYRPRHESIRLRTAMQPFDGLHRGRCIAAPSGFDYGCCSLDLERFLPGKPLFQLVRCA